jgi:lactoylglutathione lyase
MAVPESSCLWLCGNVTPVTATTGEGERIHRRLRNRGSTLRHVAVRAVGINHVALEVSDLEEAVAFYRSIFEFPEPEREPGMAFLDMGDQFLALSERPGGDRDSTRHFGLVVDDKDAVRTALQEAGVDASPPPRLNFRDPSGNLVQVVDYRDIQFSKSAEVLRGMGLEYLRKREGAIEELRAKGLTPPVVTPRGPARARPGA